MDEERVWGRLPTSEVVKDLGAAVKQLAVARMILGPGLDGGFDAEAPSVSRAFALTNCLAAIVLRNSSSNC